MNTMTKTKDAIFVILLAYLMIGVGVAAFAQTPPALTVATGKVGGGYDKASQALSQRLSQRGVPNLVKNLNGSDEISLALCSNAAQVGYMQVDAIWNRAQEGCNLKAIASYGTETAILLFPPKSDKDELDELTGADTVMVDTVGSGSELFWRTIVKIETGDQGNKSKWAQAKTNTDGLDVANAAGQMGEIQAVLLVRKPESIDVRRLLDLGWTIGSLYDKDINDLAFNGKPLYEPSYTKIKDSAGKTRKGDTYEVNSFIVVNGTVEADRPLFSKVAASTQ